MKQQPPNIYIEKRGKNEYWLASWRVEGRTKNVYLGSVAKMTREEATEKACRLKLGCVAASHTPVIDVEAIRREREQFIAEEILREAITPLGLNCGANSCREDISSTKTVICEACGSDFSAYIGEADFCPKCGGTDLRYKRENEFTIAERINWGAYYHRKSVERATKRLKILRAKKTKHPATLTIKEGWVDAHPGKGRVPNLDRLELDLGDDDNYAIYAKCGDFEFQGFKTVEEAKDALINHCGTCSERKDRCWKPDEHLAISSNAPRL